MGEKKGAEEEDAPGHLEKHLKEPLDSSSIRSNLTHPTLLSVKTQDDALACRDALDEVKVLLVELVLCRTDGRSCRSSPLLNTQRLIVVVRRSGGRRKGERSSRTECGRQQVEEKVEDVLDLVRVVRCIRRVKLEKVGNAASCKGLDSLVLVDEYVTFDEFVLN